MDGVGVELFSAFTVEILGFYGDGNGVDGPVENLAR